MVVRGPEGRGPRCPLPPRALAELPEETEGGWEPQACTGQDGARTSACLGPTTTCVFRGPGHLLGRLHFGRADRGLEGGVVRRATGERKGLLREMGPRPSVRGVPDAVVNFFTLITIRFTGDSRNVFIHHRWFGKMIN